MTSVADERQIQGGYRSLWQAVWVALACSYPLWAVFEDKYPNIGYIPAVALAIGGFRSLRSMPYAAIWSFFIVLLFSILYFYVYIFNILRPSDWEKVSQFLIVMGIFGFLLALFLINKSVIGGLTGAFLITGVLSIVLMAINPVSYQGRVSFGESNPIWIARILGLAGLASFVLLLRRPKSFWLAGILVISAIAIILTGSRGPLLALMASIVFGIVILKFSNKSSYIWIAFIAILIMSLVINQLNLEDLRVFSRDAEAATSSYLRRALYEYSFYLIESYPRGIGVGAFRFYDNIYYPHNVIIEVFVEWGWICGFLFIVALVISFSTLIGLNSSFNFLKLLFVYDLINGSLSGDVTSPRFLYGLIVFGIVLTLWRFIDSKSLLEFLGSPDIGRG